MANIIDPNPVAPDSSAPTGPEGDYGADDGLFRKLKGWALGAIEHLSEWRERTDRAYAFYSGDQWSDEERRAFEGDGRVAPIFNLTGINVDAVCGLEVNNRQDVKYLPRTQGDVKINELLSSAAMWVRDQAQSEDEESDAFKDAVICGLGVTETRKGDPETITLDRRDPTEMFYDPAAKKPNIVDRRFAGRVVMIDTDEALDMFRATDPTTGEPLPPEQQPTVQTLNAKWAAIGIKTKDVGEERLDYATGGSALPGAESQKPKKICMVEIEWFDWSNGQKVMKQAFLGATGVIEQNPLEAWAYNFITGKRDKKSNTWYGIVKSLEDPQKLINKFLATVTHILATNAKGGLLYERGAFVDTAAAERDWSNPQKNVEVTEGFLSAGRIQPRVAPPLPSGAIQLIEFAISNIRSVSGINVELLGAADRDQPASLELQRRQSAVTILASLFDAKRRYHKEQGKTLLALMKTLPPEMLVRVTVDADDPMLMPPIPPNTPPEQAQQMQTQFGQQQQAQQQAKQREMFVQFQLVMQAFQDPSIKFDVIVDEAPSSPNQQQEVSAKLAQMAASGIQLPPEAQGIIVENIGLPSTIADKLAEALSGANPQLQQMQQLIQQGQQALQQKDEQIKGLQADRSIDAQKAQIDDYKAKTERMKAAGEANGNGALGEWLIQLENKVSEVGHKSDLIGEAVLAIQGVQ